MCSELIPSSISSCDATRSWPCKSRHDMIIRRCQDKTMWKQTDKRPREKADFTPSYPFRREIWGSPNNHDHTKRDRIPRHLTTSRQRSVKNADWKFKGLFGQDKHQKKKSEIAKRFDEPEMLWSESLRSCNRKRKLGFLKLRKKKQEGVRLGGVNFTGKALCRHIWTARFAQLRVKTGMRSL